jgi:hypothetical protein
LYRGFYLGHLTCVVHPISELLGCPFARDENGFGIFRNFGNRFRNFSIGFIDNGIFRKRNQFLEFSIEIGVVFYRPFSSITGFYRKLPVLCLGIFRNCVSNFFQNFPACDFFASPVRLWIKDYLFLYFLNALRFFWIDGVGSQLRLMIWSLERIHVFFAHVMY